MDQREILWRQYQLNIDTYRGYLDLVLKMNGFYFAVTGATVSYYLAHRSEQLMKLSLLLPMIMSVALAIFFVLGAFAARITRRETFALRDKLGRTSELGLVPLEPYGERLIAYLERRTPWDS